MQKILKVMAVAGVTAAGVFVFESVPSVDFLLVSRAAPNASPAITKKPHTPIISFFLRDILGVVG